MHRIRGRPRIFKLFHTMASKQHQHLARDPFRKPTDNVTKFVLKKKN